MPKYAIFCRIRDTAVNQIATDARPGGDPGVVGPPASMPTFELRHGVREGVAQALDDLKQRQIRIGGAAAGEKFRAVFPQKAVNQVQDDLHIINDGQQPCARVASPVPIRQRQIRRGGRKPGCDP